MLPRTPDVKRGTVGGSLIETSPRSFRVSPDWSLEVEGGEGGASTIPPVPSTHGTDPRVGAVERSFRERGVDTPR